MTLKHRVILAAPATAIGAARAQTPGWTVATE